jgi:hypothetical protein
MPMFLFQFEVKSEQHEKYGGAFVNCWIKREDILIAESVAESMIRGNGWIIHRKIEGVPISRETQLSGSLKYFEQAEIDNEVVVFHTYLRDSEAADR